MIVQPGRVIRTEGGDAWVRLDGRSGCSACEAGQGCGAGIFGRLLRRRAVEVRLADSLGVAAGQGVRVGLPDGRFVALVAQCYGLPLVAGLAGAVICHYLLGSGLPTGPWRDIALLAGAVLAAGTVLRFNRSRLTGALEKQELSLLPGEPARDCRPPGCESQR